MYNLINENNPHFSWIDPGKINMGENIQPNHSWLIYFCLDVKHYTEGLRVLGTTVGQFGCSIPNTRDSWQAQYHVNGTQKFKKVVVNYIIVS